MEHQEQWSSNDGTNEVPSFSSSYMPDTEKVHWKVDAPEFVPNKSSQKSSSQTSVSDELHDSQTGEVVKSDKKTDKPNQTAHKPHKADQKPDKANEIATDATKKVDCRFLLLRINYSLNFFRNVNLGLCRLNRTTEHR